jgi:predicted dehydrogenase
MNRRTFLVSTAAAGGAAQLPASASDKATVAPSDRIRVGVIGCGSMGRMDMADFQAQPEVEIAACCDVDRHSLERALSEAHGKPAGYGDYRKLLERKDVDAVVIATPDNWHPLIAVEACDSGKDVYVEKPVGVVVREGRLMVEAARRNNRVVQVGLQQRSGSHFQRARKLVQDGVIGRILYAQCWFHQHANQVGLGHPPETEPPAGLDWDLWLGPAPKVPFRKAYVPGSWRAFFSYGGGLMTDWGVHLVDVVQWSLGADAPRSVTALGGKMWIDDLRDTPDMLSVLYEYPEFHLHVSLMPHNSQGQDGNPGNKPFNSYGIQFHGSQGTLFVDRAGYTLTPQSHEMYEPGGIGFRAAFDDLTGMSMYYTNVVPGERATTSVQHVPHVKNFLSCVKSRQKPMADIEDGHRATTTCHLGNIAYKMGGQKLVWDRDAEKFTNFAEANSLLTRRYREPWRLRGMDA